jgi:hypothetical protein
MRAAWPVPQGDPDRAIRLYSEHGRPAARSGRRPAQKSRRARSRTFTGVLWQSDRGLDGMPLPAKWRSSRHRCRHHDFHHTSQIVHSNPHVLARGRGAVTPCRPISPFLLACVPASTSFPLHVSQPYPRRSFAFDPHDDWVPGKPAVPFPLRVRVRVGHLAVLLQVRRPAWRCGSCRRPGAWHEMFRPRTGSNAGQGGGSSGSLVLGALAGGGPRQPTGAQHG